MKLRKQFNVLILLGVILFGPSCEQSRKAAKLNQYMVEGMVLYRKHCGNCHWNDGEGFKELYPPLKDADYLQNTTPLDWVCSIRYGNEDPLVINGKEYTQPMPAQEFLTALEIAEIVTYVENTWGKGRGLVEVREVEKELNACEQ